MDGNLYPELDRYIIEQKENWMKICKCIPSLHFKPEWEVKIIPPFCGAVARFTIDYNGKHVSVFLDWYGRLGCMDEPYYELYPFNGDVKRYFLHETEKLIK